MMKGNCVDKFIKNRLEARILELLDIRDKIVYRIEQRTDIEDYFNTGCYEKDFSDIIELRNTGQQLVENCNTFLERISNQYSKIE